MCRYSLISLISFYVKVMTQSEKENQGHIQMLTAFAYGYNRMQKEGAHSLFEFHILVRTELGLQKVYQYVTGHSFLPDFASDSYEDLYISLMKKDEIENYLKQCKTYGIK